jgi:hypothetical protein
LLAKLNLLKSLVCLDLAAESKLGKKFHIFFYISDFSSYGENIVVKVELPLPSPTAAETSSEQPQLSPTAVETSSDLPLPSPVAAKTSAADEPKAECVDKKEELVDTKAKLSIR